MPDPVVSFEEARRLTLGHIRPLPAEDVDLVGLVGRVTAGPILAQVDSPSVDASLKDGYAVHSAEVAHASPAAPVRLRLIGQAAAEIPWEGMIEPGTTIRILTGAQIPAGTEAIVAEEFTRRDGDYVLVTAPAHPGRNILPRGCDVRTGQEIFPAGTRLSPSQVGLLAAAGHTSARVIRKPRVAILATGDEVLAPGVPLQPGKLFASNLVTLAAWCARYGLPVTTHILPDDAAHIEAALRQAVATHDALITSGGIWTGERDLVVGILDWLGWTRFYHRIRLGPGKGAAMGLLDGKSVFCLPGGPPSNHVAFLMLALPGLLTLEGQRDPGLPSLIVELAEDLRGQDDWTQCVHGRLERRADKILFYPLKTVASRLQMMADADALVTIPEGVDCLPAGTAVPALVLA